MPGLVKIGCTSQEEVAARLNQLYSTGVPFPFDVEFAARVDNPEAVEQALHEAFGPNRVNPRREFFQIDPSQARAILKLVHIDDATDELEQVAVQLEPQDSAAAREFRGRRPPLNFIEMGIPLGSLLLFTDGVTSVVVTAPKRVSLDGIETSLTAATQQLLALPYSVAPGPYWTWNGRRLRDIYDQTYRHES